MESTPYLFKAIYILSLFYRNPSSVIQSVILSLKHDFKCLTGSDMRKADCDSEIIPSLKLAFKGHDLSPYTNTADPNVDLIVLAV